LRRERRHLFIWHYIMASKYWFKQEGIHVLFLALSFWVSVGVWALHAAVKEALSMPSILDFHEASPYFLSSCGRQNSRTPTRFLPIVHIFSVTPSHIDEQDSGYDGLSLTQLDHHSVDFEFVKGC
jgi:hypothetical protein